MAVKSVTISDISGEEIADDKAVRVVIDEHPSLNFAVELDVTPDEAAKFQPAKLELVQIAVFEPGRPPRRVVVEAKSLESLFGDVKFDDVLAGARQASSTFAAPRVRQPSRTSASKRDYSGPEWAGVEHRGRTSEAEAAWVRENLDKANANRAREGQSPIDVNDEKMKRRFGL